MQLRDEQTERCLFAGILCDPGVLEQCADVECDDFSCLHLKAAFTAIRNLQARGSAIDIDSIAFELHRNGYVQVDIDRLYATLAEDYVYQPGEVDEHRRWLRKLARRRAAV